MAKKERQKKERVKKAKPSANGYDGTLFGFIKIFFTSIIIFN
jgi:hypothetical protein